MRSRLEPMKKFVRTLRNHEELLMNDFKAGKGYSSGIVEGLNLKINLGIRKAYGYRSFDRFFDIFSGWLQLQTFNLPATK